MSYSYLLIQLYRDTLRALRASSILAPFLTLDILLESYLLIYLFSSVIKDGVTEGAFLMIFSDLR